MIPIVSIATFIAFLVTLVISLYLRRIYKKSKTEMLKYFLCFFVSATFLFLSISTPFLIFKNILLITFSLYLTPAFLYLSLGFIILISLRILKWPRVEKIYLATLILLLVFSYLIILFEFKPVQINTVGNFIYWTIPSSRILWRAASMVIGTISGITLLSVSVFFFVGGFKSKERFIRKRAFLMAIGMFLLTLAGAISFIIGGVPTVPISGTSSLLAILGILILFWGIVIIRPNPMKHET